jgi:hypothetical protein
MTKKPKLQIAFHDRTHTKTHDSLSLDLTTGKIT